MATEITIYTNLWIAVPLVIWTLAWKGRGMWRAAQNRQPVWFIVMFLVQSLGIIPIVYLALLQKAPKPKKARKKRK